jgi:hypothetical protein
MDEFAVDGWTRHSQAPSSTTIIALNAHVRVAFREAWRDIFKVPAQVPPSTWYLRKCLPGFDTHYRSLTALPRRTRRSMQRKWKHTLGAIALLMTLGQAPAWAATIEVTPGTPPSIKADGKCSLIEAIVNANRDRRTHLDCVAGAGADTIVLPARSTQALGAAQSLPQITSRIVIEGRGSTIRRNTSTPSYLNFLNITAAGDLTLNETTISGATASGVPGGYGGINNAGGLLTLHGSSIQDTRGQSGLINSGRATLQDSTVSGNGFGYPRTYYGGGITNNGGATLVLRNSTVSGNGAQRKGGGISNWGSLSLIDSVVSKNSITYEGGGGGIMNDGTLVLTDTTVSDNSATYGGGILNRSNAIVRRSTITGNRATWGYSGGGIANSGRLTLGNSTVSNNEAQYYGGGIASGVFRNPDSSLTLLSSTVTGNSVVVTGQAGGGGIFVYAGTLTLERSIVSGNRYDSTYHTSREIGVATGVAVTVNDHNLFGHDGDAGVAGFVPASTDSVPNESLEGILLPLADNGGGTKTHALAIGSPALDASPDDATCPATDQRGNPRPRGPACDIGAFEGVAVLCNGKLTTMVGTVNDDHLTGTAGPDVISGLTGDDTILGLDGNDVVCAGSGNDVLYGGADSDLLFGEPGDDRLFGQGGNDTLNGGVDVDVCDGGSGAGDIAATCETIRSVP